MAFDVFRNFVEEVNQEAKDEEYPSAQELAYQESLKYRGRENLWFEEQSKAYEIQKLINIDKAATYEGNHQTPLESFLYNNIQDPEEEIERNQQFVENMSALNSENLYNNLIYSFQNSPNATNDQVLMLLWVQALQGNEEAIEMLQNHIGISTPEQLQQYILSIAANHLSSSQQIQEK